MIVPLTVATLLTFVAWIAAATLSLQISDTVTHSAAVWLSTGVTFGALLAVKPAKRPGVLLGAGCAAVLLALRDGLSPWQALGFGLNEVVSAGMGAWWALRLRAGDASGRTRPDKAYGGLLLGGLLTASLGASVALLLWSWVDPGQVQLGREWRVWFLSGFCGVLLVAPLVLSFAGFRVKRSGGLRWGQFVAGALACLLFFVVTALIFSADVTKWFGASLGPTLTYLPLPFIVVTAIFWKERGGALATFLGAVAMMAWTHAGAGPFSAVEGFSGEAVIEVQGYVVVMALLVGIVNALGATAVRALAEAQDWRTRYRQVLDSSRTVMADFDAVTGRARWGEGASALMRTDVSRLLAIGDVIAHAEPATQPGLQADWDDLAQGRRANVSWDVELFWGDGGSVPVSGRLSGVRGADGRVELVAALFEVDESRGG